jgi:hypothetical protein
VESVYDIGGQWFKEIRWNLEFSLSETDRALGFSVRRKGTNFSDWNIALA